MRCDIHSVLVIWGRQWARFKDCKGYPSLQPFMREAPKVNCYYGVMSLDDASCLLIEKQVMKLHEINLVQYQILMAKYVLLLEDKAVWRALEISRASYHQQLALAKTFMLGAVLGQRSRFGYENWR